MIRRFEGHNALVGPFSADAGQAEGFSGQGLPSTDPLLNALPVDLDPPAIQIRDATPRHDPGVEFPTTGGDAVASVTKMNEKARREREAREAYARQYAPRGEANLKDALDLLGPFDFETVAEARTGRRRDPSAYMHRPKGFPTSREEAEDDVRVVAIGFNGTLAEDARALRVKHVVSALLRLEEAYGALAKLERSLDDEAAYALDLGFIYVAGNEKIPPEAVRAFKEALGGLGRPAGGGGSAELPRLHDYLSRAAGFAAANVATLMGSGSVDAPDVGGNVSVYRKRVGHPKRNLVLGVLQLWRKYRTDEPTGNVTNGRFFSLVCAIYGFATGQSAFDKGVGLERWVKVVQTAEARAQVGVGVVWSVNKTIQDLNEALATTRGKRKQAKLRKKIEQLTARLPDLKIQADLLVRAATTGESEAAILKRARRSSNG